MTGQTPTAPAEYYADTTVIAYRAPESDMADLHPKVTSSSGTIDAALLSDGLYVKSTALPKAAMGEKAWVQFEFPEPHRFVQ